DQRNFAVDFRLPPEIHTISDVRVTVNSAYRVRSCLLYRRRLITPGSSRVINPIPPPPEPPPLTQKFATPPESPPTGRISDSWPSEERTDEQPRTVDPAQPKKRRRLE